MARTAAPSVRALFLLAAMVCLGYSLQIGNGALRQHAFPWLCVAFGLALLGVVAGPGHAQPRGWTSLVLLAAAPLALAFQTGLLLLAPPGLYLRPQDPTRFVFLQCLALALASLGLLGRPPLERGRIALLLLVHFMLGVWLIGASPKPHIDVYAWHLEAIQALFDARNPYAMTMPDIYGHGGFYGPGLLLDGRVQVGFPYPPLSLLLAVPGQLLLGDYRYSLLVAMTLAGLFLMAARPGPLASTAAALLLFTPRNLFVLEQGWTDPFVVLMLAATVAVGVRRPRWLFVPLGLLFAVKHYVLLAAPLLVLAPVEGGPRERLRQVLRAAGVAALVTLPFALLDPAAFAADLVGFQLRQPFRADALSFLAFWAERTGVRLPSWLGLMAALVASAVALWRAERSWAGFAASVGLVFFAFFAFGKQAFCNYYYFVIGALACAVASEHSPRAPGAPAPTR